MLHVQSQLNFEIAAGLNTAKNAINKTRGPISQNKGCNVKARGMLNLKNSTNALVNPQVGHGKPVMALKGQMAPVNFFSMVKEKASAKNAPTHFTVLRLFTFP